MNKTLAKWIDNFCESNQSARHAHIDEFVRKLTKDTWLSRTMELGNSAVQYISNKGYKVNIIVGVELKNKRQFFTPTEIRVNELSSVPPFFILTRDNKFLSEYTLCTTLSDLYGHPCYYWQPKENGWFRTVIYINVLVKLHQQ